MRVIPAVAFPLLIAFGLSACLSDSATKPGAPEPDLSCDLGRSQEPEVVVGCLATAGAITGEMRDSALAVFADLRGRIDSLRATGVSNDYGRASEFSRALVRITQFYSRGLFPDSVRFNRMMDQVRITIDYVEGKVTPIGPRLWPDRTPYLSWNYYPNLGIYFQPVNTIQSVSYLKPRANVPTDSLLAMGEALYHYAVWRTGGGRRFPVWEYEFTWNSGGIVNFAPWISGQAQGYALMLFAENHRRTGDPLWRDRGYETLRSLQTMWDDGGVLLPDTTHGYWWEEFHPTARIWNGAAQAVLGVGNFWKATNDPEVGRMFDRGIEAMLYYTPEYDTGTWTLYSKVQGNNTIAYHNSHIAILDELYNLSGIQWFKDEADKYRTYTPPPGVS